MTKSGALYGAGRLHRRDVAASSRKMGAWFIIVTVIFVLVHGLFGWHDVRNPADFLHGDRSEPRSEKIAAFNAAGPNRAAYVYDAGPPGDYIAHAVVEKVGGPTLVIATQVLLTLGSVLAAMLMAVRLTGRDWSPAVAGLMALFACGMLMNPHLLVTEPWSTFFLTLGCALCLEALYAERTLVLFLGFVSFAAASFFRPGNLLVPVAAGAALIVLRETGVKKALLMVIASYCLFPGLWLAIRYAATGEVGLGPSDFDLNRNFWLRASRVAIPGDSFDPYVGMFKMPFGPFLSVMLAHPWASVKTFVADAANLFLNPGTNMVFGHYLGVVNTPDDVWFFRNLLDSHGLFAVIQAIAGLGVGFVIIYIVFAVPQLLVLCSYVVVPTVALRSQGKTSRATLFLWWIMAASLLGVFAAGGIRWTQRSTVEPMSATLVAVMVSSLLQGGRIRQVGSRATPAAAL